MKFVAALFALIGGATAASEAPRAGRGLQQGSDGGIAPDDRYALYTSLLERPPCLGLNPDDTAPAADAAWQACKAHVALKMEEHSPKRRLQTSGPTNNDYPGSYTEGSSADFLAPCYPLPTDPVAEGWIQLVNQGGTLADDGSKEVDLGFTFNLYGKMYQQAFVAANGLLTFEMEFSQFVPLDFPNPVVDMVAPFWADIDARDPRGTGNVWYKFFGDHMAIIWDAVGYANFGNPTYKTNTFQAVISDGGSSLGEGNNVCFCYIDMDWWTGGFFRNAPATVGINSKDGASDSFVQVGRFFGEGDAYDGAGPNLDGIDWLDYRGSNITRGDVNYTDPIQGMCFDARAPENIPPVISGFPANDTYNVPCYGQLDLTVNFATPEMGQEIVVTLPPNVADIQGLSVVQSGTSEFVSVVLNWSPDFATQSGTYLLTFTASDRVIGRSTSFLSTITTTLTIVVAQCGDDDDVPENCTPIIGSTCTEGDPQPFCTPHRSPEHCPMDESFPTYIHTRNQIIQSNPATIEGLNYWFHYLEDKAAAYAFTASSGYNAPKLLCCASPSSWMTDCFPPGGVNPTSFVVRAVGDQHSNAAVYVLPSGFGGPELTRPLAAMTMVQVHANIQGLASPATKIIVEEYIAGSPSGPSALPNEYKVHAFNGEVGAINMILNRGSDCACYAEVDEDWNRLDLNGCFVPNMPFGQEYQTCYNVDFQQGANSPYPMKGHDLCGPLALVSPSCLLTEIVKIAQEISLLLGVYVRIDFFVGGDNKVYVQEYTFNHNNGLRHCSSKINDDTGCIDSCFLGRMWKESGSTPDEIIMGGPATTLPAIFESWTSTSMTDQCIIAVAQTPPQSLACSEPIY
mmetsp:Transcript_5507/g.9095  ORF Transcript_5507/g.9095 Transcript_5507/m.9095 type:complete len:852 (-) Transcript_5507:96-2651(-)